MPDVRPITPAIGAEVEGVDLRKPLSDDLGAELSHLLARHHVLVFRAQHLDLAAQKRLTAAFGPLLRLPYVEPMEGEPEVIRVLKEADEGGGVFGGDWHADFSFLERPPRGSILAAAEVPPTGGDTLFASQAAAWEHLPTPFRQLLSGRDAMHVGKPYGVRWAPPVDARSGRSIRMSRGDPTADVERAHPAVIRNPLTGVEALFLNPLYVCRLDGLTEDESRPLLAQIQAHTIRPEFTCRIRWGAGDVAVWDNLFTQHFAVNDYFGHRRLMHRTTFAGESPREIAARGGAAQAAE
jgi:taurine dioxygenase